MARFTRARKFGRDEEADRQDLKEVIDDPDADFGDILACAIEAASPEEQSEVIEALRSMGEDRRGARAWAKDRREVYRHNADDRRRAGANRHDSQALDFACFRAFWLGSSRAVVCDRPRSCAAKAR